MDDEQLLALKKNGGVIQIVGFASYVKADSKERTEALAKLREEFGLAFPGGGRGGRGGGGRGRGAGVRTRGSEFAGPVRSRAPPVLLRRAAGAAGDGEMRFSMPFRPSGARNTRSSWPRSTPSSRPRARANVKDFVNHIDYAVKLIGIDHVGISSDFDGGGGIDGWNSAAEAFNVTLELVRRGYTEEQIGKLWSGNLLRVWGEVEKVSQKLQKGQG